MSIKVKICGLRTPESVDAALDAGAEYFGLVMYPPSPRNVSLDDAQALAEHGRGRAKSVVLLVDPDDDTVRDVAEQVNPDLIQLHGKETPGRVRAIRAASGRPVIKAIRVATEEDARTAADYEDVADIVLFDALPPADDETALPGGNGIPFDWTALAGTDRKKRAYILSGGLTCENIGDAIAATGTNFVDVSSGVESTPGEKDNQLIRRFIAAAKALG